MNNYQKNYSHEYLANLNIAEEMEGRTTKEINAVLVMFLIIIVLAGAKALHIF